MNESIGIGIYLAIGAVVGVLFVAIDKEEDAPHGLEVVCSLMVWPIVIIVFTLIFIGKWIGKRL